METFTYLGRHTPKTPRFDGEGKSFSGHCFLRDGGMPLFKSSHPVMDWCNENLARHRWMHIELFSTDEIILVFDDDDAFAFRMRWC